MHFEQGAYVYMLRCSDGSFGGYTSKRRPVVLVWHQHRANITDAIAAERQIKGWSRRKKEALIAGDFDALRALASRSEQALALRDAPCGRSSG